METAQARLSAVGEAPPLPPGGMSAAAAAHDWAATPLGPRESWSPELKSAASIVLGSNVPMFLVWGPDLLVVHNDSYGEILGDRRPALGRPLREIWSDIWHIVGPNTDRVLGGETLYLESAPRPLRRGGEERTAWLTCCFNPIRERGGTIAGIFGVVTSICEDERTAEQLRESEDRFRLIADSAPVPMWVTLLDRRRGFVNRAYVDFLGIGYEEAVDYDWRAIIHPDDAPRILAESLVGEASLEPFELEGRFRRHDGEWRWLRSISLPRWGAGGEHVGFIGVAHDITELKLAEQALRDVNETLENKVEERTADLRAALDRLQGEVAERERAEQALRQAQKMEAVGRLTGGIAHDFNNLLTPVIGGLEVLAAKVSDRRLKALAETALDSGRRGAKLATQLLTFSRTQRLRIAPVDVNGVIGNLREMLDHTLSRAIRVKTALDTDACHAMCDENQLENAVLNLAINARDAMPNGGALTISTAIVEEEEGEVEPGRYVRVRVADTGQGMTAETLARAAEPFFSTKPMGKGTGLGLAQVYGVARQSGGALRIESREGEGTCVDILLPCAAPGASAVEIGLHEAEPRARPRSRIMIVDDDAIVRTFLAELVAAMNHEVIALESGPAALSALESGPPDLLLLDYAMPVMNGAQVAAAVRVRYPDLPIAFVTGYANSEEIEAVLGEDVNVLRKPFGASELERLVAKMLPAAELPQRLSRAAVPPGP